MQILLFQSGGPDATDLVRLYVPLHVLSGVWNLHTDGKLVGIDRGLVLT